MCTRNQVTHSRSHGRSSIDLTILGSDLDLLLLLLSPDAERHCKELCRYLITVAVWNRSVQDARRDTGREQGREGDK